MPSSVINSDNGVSSGTTGLKTTGGDDGVLKIQTNGTDAMTVNGSQVVTFAKQPIGISTGFSGATINAASASALTLTNTSTQYQQVQSTSTTNNVVNLPNATTLSTEGGPVFLIDNRNLRNQILEIKDNGGNLLSFISPSNLAHCTLADNSTANGIWTVTANGIYQAIEGDAASITAPGLTLDGSRYGGLVLGLTSTKFVFMWASTTSPSTTTTIRAKVGDISGSTITFGSEQTVTVTTTHSNLDQNRPGSLRAIRLSDSSFALFHGIPSNNGSASFISNQGVRTCTVSGTTITFGTASALSFPTGSNNAGEANGPYAASLNVALARMADNKFAVIYNTGVSTSIQYPTGFTGSLGCNIITVSGTTQTVGTKVDLSSSTFTQPLGVVSYDTDRLLVIYGQGSSGSTTGRSKMVVISVSGTTPTWNTPVNIQGADSACQAGDTSTQKAAFAVSTTKCFVPYIDGSVKGAYVNISGTTPSLDWSNIIWGYDPYVYPTVQTSTNVLVNGVGSYTFYSADGFYSANYNSDFSSAYKYFSLLPGATAPNLISYNNEWSANARVQLVSAKTTL